MIITFGANGLNTICVVVAVVVAAGEVDGEEDADSRCGDRQNNDGGQYQLFSIHCDLSR
jgi:hypothetical protein